MTQLTSYSLDTE